MREMENRITAPQLFCLVFCCVFSGLRLYCGESFAAVLFVCLFCAVVCVVSAAVSESCGSFYELCRAAFGKCGFILRAFCVFLLALPLLAALSELAHGAAGFYEKGSVGAVLSAAVFLCVFAAAKVDYIHIVLRKRACAVKHGKHKLCALQLALGDVDTDFFDDVVRLSDSGCISKTYRNIADGDDFFDGISGGSRNFRYDGSLFTQKSIHQRRFSRIWLT